MAIVVEHDKRKHEILQKSLDVFIDEGYEDATFQKIADRCGITRTTLYIYFKNKYEIFLGSLKELLAELEVTLKTIITNDKISSEETLRQMMMAVADCCEQNKKLFSVLLNYLMQLKKSGVDTNERVRRRVLRLRHLMSTVLIKGIQNKEFKDLNVKDVNEMFYGLMEAAIFRIAVLNQEDINELRNSMNTAIDSFKL